jgi:hypothetical protein
MQRLLIVHLFGNAPICACASTILECSCCRIHIINALTSYCTEYRRFYISMCIHCVQYIYKATNISLPSLDSSCQKGERDIGFLLHRQTYIYCTFDAARRLAWPGWLQTEIQVAWTDTAHRKLVQERLCLTIPLFL